MDIRLNAYNNIAFGKLPKKSTCKKTALATVAALAINATPAAAVNIRQSAPYKFAQYYVESLKDSGVKNGKFIDNDGDGIPGFYYKDNKGKKYAVDFKNGYEYKLTPDGGIEQQRKVPVPWDNYPGYDGGWRDVPSDYWDDPDDFSHANFSNGHCNITFNLNSYLTDEEKENIFNHEDRHCKQYRYMLDTGRRLTRGEMEYDATKYDVDKFKKNEYKFKGINSSYVNGRRDFVGYSPQKLYDELYNVHYAGQCDDVFECDKDQGDCYSY